MKAFQRQSNLESKKSIPETTSNFISSLLVNGRILNDNEIPDVTEQFTNQTYFEYVMIDDIPHEFCTINDEKVYIVRNKFNKKLYFLCELRKGTIQKVSQIKTKYLHRNSTRIICSFQDNPTYDYAVISYFNSMSLYNKLQIKSSFEEEFIFEVAIQIISYMDFIHKNNIVLKELKPENILINKKNKVKIVSFDVFKSDSTELNSLNDINIEYLSPEMIVNLRNNTDYSITSQDNIWFLGILLYELYHGYTPFVNNVDLDNSIDNIENDILSNIVNFKYNFKENTPVKFRSLLEKIFLPSKERASLMKILSSTWIEDKEKEVVSRKRKEIDKLISNHDEYNINKSFSSSSSLNESVDEDDSRHTNNNINNINNINHKQSHNKKESLISISNHILEGNAFGNEKKSTFKSFFNLDQIDLYTTNNHQSYRLTNNGSVRDTKFSKREYLFNKIKANQLNIKAKNKISNFSLENINIDTFDEGNFENRITIINEVNETEGNKKTHHSIRSKSMIFDMERQTNASNYNEIKSIKRVSILNSELNVIKNGIYSEGKRINDVEYPIKSLESPIGNQNQRLNISKNPFLTERRMKNDSNNDDYYESNNNCRLIDDVSSSIDKIEEKIRNNFNKKKKKMNGLSNKSFNFNRKESSFDEKVNIAFKRDNNTKNSCNFLGENEENNENNNENSYNDTDNNKLQYNNTFNKRLSRQSELIDSNFETNYSDDIRFFNKDIEILQRAQNFNKKVFVKKNENEKGGFWNSFRNMFSFIQCHRHDD